MCSSLSLYVHGVKKQNNYHNPADATLNDEVVVKEKFCLQYENAQYFS